MSLRTYLVLGVLTAVCAALWQLNPSTPASSKETSEMAPTTRPTVLASPESSLPQATTAQTKPTEPNKATPIPASVREPRTHTLISQTGTAIEWNSDTPAAHSATQVTLNTALFTPESTIRTGDTLRIELFGENYAAEVTHVNQWNNGTVGITTKLPGDPLSRAYLSYTGDVARLLVQDRATHKTYQIRYDTETQTHVALDVNLVASDIRGCLVDSHFPDANALVEAALAQADEAATPTPQTPPSAEAQPAPTDTVTFNLMVVYTPAALSNEGSLANIQNNISSAVLTANNILSNSQINATVNLAHTAEVSYTEVDPSTDLDRLTNPSDGYIDNVHTLRDTYEADFVSFFIVTSGGGLGWTNRNFQSPTRAFHVARVQQTDFTSTMIHEMGHNMGVGHSATQTSYPGPGDVYPFSAGWQWADSSSPASIGYCSVMTYENFDGDAGNGNEYLEVDYFSNPNITYNGNPVGDAATGDAARVIQLGRFEYASYRGPTITISDTINTFPYTNSFENNLDYFYQDGSDEHFWIGTQSGDTFQNPTGPSMGAQDGTYYAYVIGYDGTAYYNKTANLLANVDFTGKTNATLNFYYHMYDGGTNHMGSLHVDASTNGGSTWDTDLWTISGNQGDSWHSQQVDLSAYDNTSIILRFRVITGPNFLTDTCIDNVTISANDTITYANWISTNYPGISDSTSTADPDNDGVSNFLEYTLGMAPDSADLSGLPTAALNSGSTSLEITFKRAQAGVRYVVESSNTPDFASPTEQWDSATEPGDLVAAGNNQTVSVTIPVGARIFLRVRTSE